MHYREIRRHISRIFIIKSQLGCVTLNETVSALFANNYSEKTLLTNRTHCMNFSHARKTIEVDINNLYIAGYTGRNTEDVNHHINELAELGISPPSKVPLFYRVSRNLLTQNNNIQVLGHTTSGEVEPLLVKSDNTLFIGLASDHTDRQLEAHSIAASKQACPKPVASDLWRFDTVQNHIDELILRCSIYENAQWNTYQKGTLDNILPLADLMDEINFTNNDAMLCGTLGAIGGVRPVSQYKMELVDPVLDQIISLAYTTEFLNVVE